MTQEFKFGNEAMHQILEALGLGAVSGSTQRLVLDFGEGLFPTAYLQFAPTSDMLDKLATIEGLDVALATDGQARAIYEVVSVGIQRDSIIQVLNDEMLDIQSDLAEALQNVKSLSMEDNDGT